MMLRLRFLVALSAALASAQSVDSRLAELTHKTHRPFLPPSAGERLGSAIDQTRAALLQLERTGSADIPQALREERGKLALLDQAYGAEFFRIESTLRGAGLPPEVLTQKLDVWREFTRHYRHSMDLTLAGFDHLSQSALARDPERTRRELGALRASLGVGMAIRPPARISESAPARQAARAPFPRAEGSAIATDLPTPGDLAASKTVLLTPDIIARAAAFGNSPAALFAYVYNQIHYTPYYLLQQNSQAVLWSGKANDADQATLLIALLRASGIPARYVLGYLQIPVADAINWVGAKDRAGAVALLTPATFFTDMGDRFRITHTWVEAWLDTPNGKAWVPMTPSIKQQVFHPGIVLPKPGFDRAAFLRSVNSRLGTEIYADQIHAAFQQANPGRDFTELPYAGTIVPAASDMLPPFPYAPEDPVLIRAEALPSQATWTIGITLTDYANKSQVFLPSTALSFPEICLQSLTVAFAAATPADQRVIDSFGGLDKVPAGMVNMLAQILLDGAVIATATAPAANERALELTVTQTGPYGAAPSVTASHFLVAGGESAAIGLAAGNLSDGLIAARIDRQLAQLPTAAPGDIVRETLHIASLRYFQRYEAERQRVFRPLQYASALLYPEEALTFAPSNVTNLFDRPFLATPGQLTIDVGVLSGFVVDLNAPAAPTVAFALNQAVGVTSSGLEAELWEEIVLIPSICTVKALQLANQNGIPIVVVSAANAAALLPTIQAPAATISELASEIQQGYTITIPKRPVSFGAWTGFGWIQDLPDGRAGFKIQKINGGDTGGNPPQPMPPTGNPGPTGDPAPTNGTACSDPVTVSNGNLFQQQIDLAISTRGPGIVLQRTYNSLNAAGDSPFGFGWTHNYRLSLKDNQTSVTFVDETGGVFSFALQGAAYISPAGLNLSLAKDASGYTLRSTHGRLWRFDAKGVLQSIADRNGNALQLSYDSAGRLARLTDALGRMVTLSYDASNHVASVQDSANRKIAYTYDAAGNLTSVTDAAGNRTIYSYFADKVFAHLLQTVTKPAGNSTSFEYFANQKVARISDSAGRNMRFLYMPLRNETIFIDARGFSGSYYYNALGNVTRIVKPDGTYVDTTYTPDAKLAAQTDENGFATRYAYDAPGNLISVTDPLGNTAKFTYEPSFNQVATITNAQGAVTKLEYDARGNLTHVVKPLGVEGRFTYDNFGQLLTATDAEGHTSSIAYDQNGNPMRIADPAGNSSQFEFDNLRRVTRLVDPMGGATTIQLDALDRFTGSVNPLGSTVSVAYNANGNLSQVTDRNGQVTRYSYDALDNLSAVTGPRSSAVQYGYATPDCGCSAGANLVSFTDAAGVAHAHAYDFDDRLTQVADPLQNVTGFAYNARGNLVRKTDANGSTIQFEYDPGGRPVHKIFPDGTDVRLSYDSSGNLISATNANTSLTFTYDDLSRMTSVTDSRFAKTLKNGYNRNGLRTTRTDSEGGVTTYAYDANSRLTLVTNPSGATAQLAYDALNRLTTLAYSNGIATPYQYDAASELIAIGGAAPLPQFTYTYDKNGNPTSIADLAGAHSYQFDELNRLTAATHPSQIAESYSYDGAGNRMASATDSNYTYDAAGRLIAAEGVSFTYDRNGNVTARSDGNGTTTYNYNFENQLIGILFRDGTNAAYKYDPLGRRIEKNVNGAVTAYLYDGPHILLELDQSGQMLARYTHGPGVDNPFMMERGSQTYFYHGDRLGSVGAITDAFGNAICTYSYDSFGRTGACQGLQNPFGFAGREYDAESGLYYMRARYYDPAIGRFLSSDPLDVTGLLLQRQLALMGSPQQLNAYSYAVNNPLAFRDPSGLKCGKVKVHVFYTEGVGSQYREHDIAGQIQTQDVPGWLKNNGYLLGSPELLKTSDGSMLFSKDINLYDASTLQLIGLVEYSPALGSAMGIPGNYRFTPPPEKDAYGKAVDFVDYTDVPGIFSSIGHSITDFYSQPRSLFTVPFDPQPPSSPPGY